MTVFNTLDMTALREQLDRQTGLIIACYCAAWCDTCSGYQTEFNDLSRQWPQHTFIWIDIEDDPHLLDNHDVDNFPTILVQSDQGNFFFGEQLPYISHLARLITHIEQGGMPVTDHGPQSLRILVAAAD